MTSPATRPPSTRAPARPRPTPQQRLRNAAAESAIRLLRQHGPVTPPRDRSSGGGTPAKVDARAGSYDAASTSRTRAGGPAIGGSFDAHLDARTHDLIRRDVRHVVRNSNAARAALKRIVSAINGAGLTLSVGSDDEAWRDLVKAEWIRDSANFDARGGAAGGQTIEELASMWLFNVALDGDGLLVLLANGKIQYVESDRIVTPGNRRGVIKNSTQAVNPSFGPHGGYRRSGRNATAETEDGNIIVSGVEMDDAGAPVAFWVAPHDAADSGGRVLADKAVRVPAENCIWLKQPWTPWANATRGEPVLAGSLVMLEAIERLLKAEVLAAELAAYIALIIKTEAPAEMADTLQSIAEEAGNIAGGGGPNSGSHDDDYTGGGGGGGGGGSSGSSQTAQQWGPGAVLNLNTGEDIETTNPTRPNQLVDPFVRSMLRLVFADLGISVDMGLLDASQSNFHAFKSSTAHTYRGFEPVVGWLMRVESQIYTWWLRGKIAGGEIPPREDWDSHAWTPQPLPTPDEGKLFDALANGVKECLIPLEHAHDVLGLDTKTVLKRSLEEAPRVRAIKEARGDFGGQNATTGNDTDANDGGSDNSDNDNAG